MLKLIRKLINKTTQKQIAGDASTNLQAGTIHINQGLTYAEYREIALDIYKVNAIQMKAEAAEIVKERVEEITEKILTKINERNPEAFKEFKNPALQDALYTVQKQFAKTGEQDLGDLLVDILVDRAALPKRNMLQIVLDESLNIAPKLTIEQLDSITINFLLVQTRRNNIRNFVEFKQYITTLVLPFLENLSDERTYYNHIEYLGCGHIRVGDYGSLENRIRNEYRVFFSNGFTNEEFIAEFEDIETYKWSFIPCFHNSEKMQLSFYDDAVLTIMCKDKKISDENIEKLKQFFNKTTKLGDEIKSILSEAIPEVKKLFDIWATSPIKNLELTSVGIAIAHANYRRKTGETMDLSIWIK